MQNAPKRRLILTSPHLRGNDVRTLQAAINNRRRARGLSTIKVDGEYGPSTSGAMRDTARILGAQESTIKQGATVGIQRIIREPGRRTPAQLARARNRKRAAERQGEGPDAALKWAVSKIGVKEHPPGSNTGPQIRDWQTNTGMGAGPWCAAFSSESAKAGGVLITDEARYTPWLVGHAKAGTGGYERFVGVRSDLARPADHVLFNFDGVPGPEHVGVLESRNFDNGTITTIDGNTGGDGQSQDNGGIVLRKTRPMHLVQGIACVRWAA